MIVCISHAKVGYRQAIFSKQRTPGLERVPGFFVSAPLNRHARVHMSQNFPPSLEVLVRTIEKDIYRQPKSVIEPLHQLLERCTGDEQLCYAYEQLGFAHLLLAQHRMARIFYERALALQPENIYVLANLAHAVYELGDKTAGVEYGRRALGLKDKMATAAGKLGLGQPHGGKANLISFSLYGSKARYCETAVLNCLAASQHFPGFVCRFYVDQSVPGNVIKRLREHSAEIVSAGGRAASFPPTFWRFLAIDEKDANIVLVRDADSIIDDRDAYCVNEWMKSKKPFHIIRDDCCHTELIQAGIFAARSGVVRDIEESIASFVAAEENQPVGRFADQLFLRKCVWPVVREHAVTHDTVYGYGTDVRDVPSALPGRPGIRNAFIGANYATYRLQLSTREPIPESVLYFVRIIGQAGATVCEYPMELVNRQELQIFLPVSYAKQLEIGAWGYEIYSENSQNHSRTLVTKRDVQES